MEQRTAGRKKDMVNGPQMCSCLLGLKFHMYAVTTCWYKLLSHFFTQQNWGYLPPPLLFQDFFFKDDRETRPLPSPLLLYHLPPAILSHISSCLLISSVILCASLFSFYRPLHAPNVSPSSAPGPRPPSPPCDGCLRQQPWPKLKGRASYCIVAWIRHAGWEHMLMVSLCKVRCCWGGCHWRGPSLYPRVWLFKDRVLPYIAISFCAHWICKVTGEQTVWRYVQWCHFP